MNRNPSMFRVVMATFALLGLFLAGFADQAAAQGKAKGRKHDVVPPHGPPCPVAQRPCPPGHGYLPPPGHKKNGKAADAMVFVLAETQAYKDLLSSVELGTPAGADAFSASARTRVLSLFRAEGETPDILVESLAPEANHGARSEAETLVTALQDLPQEEGHLTVVAEAFNAFLDASSQEFLKDPPQEFLVVHGFLEGLVNEAVTDSSGSR